MNKKGQSISINTIIVAALALAVLVVLFAIFTGRIGGFSKGVGETASCENSCRALGMRFDTLEGGSIEISAKNCRDDTSKTYVPGSYTDVKSATAVCCCSK